jgi:hypothetical protein
MKNRLFAVLAGVLFMLAGSQAHAQYTQIPDEPNGSGCPGTPSQCSGYKVRADINARFGGTAPTSPLIEGITYNPTYLTFSTQRSYQTGDTYIDLNATNGNITYTLPPWTSGLQLSFKRMDATTNTVTIAANGSDTIDGHASIVLLAKQPRLIGGSGSMGQWDILGSVETARAVNGEVNVRDYGATGSGDFGTDDALAIQSAINAACLSNNVSDSHVTATTVRFPAGSYKMTYPAWVNCAGLTLEGVGMYASALSPSYDFGPTVAFAAQAYPGIPLATRLLSGDPSTYNSFDFTADRSHQEWLNLREWDGVNGAAGNGVGPSGMNLNGLSAFSVEAYINLSVVESGEIVASGSIPTASKGQVAAFELAVNGNQLQASLNTSNGFVNFVSGGALSANTTYYVALSYDGSNLRGYLCIPGASACAPDFAGAATGTIVQDPTEDVDVGELVEDWPDGSVASGPIDGKVYSVRVSNVARYTGTIATVPSAAFTGDSNTLILTNGEQAPGGAPFIKAYDTAYASAGYGWLFGFNTNRAGSGNYIIEQNGMRQMGIRPGGADTSGVIYVGGHDGVFDSIVMSPVEIGWETFNLAYENRFSNIAIFANGYGGRYGIVDATGLNSWSGTKVSTEWACEVAQSGTYFNPECIQGNSGTSRYGFVLECLGGGNNGATLYDPVDDAENSANAFTSLDVLANTDTCVLDVTGGNPQAEDSSAVAVLDSGGTVNFFGTQLTSQAGSPTQIIQAAGSTSGTAMLFDPILAGWGSATLSSTASVATASPCKGRVTLASGAGTFSNVCVTPNSNCTPRDVTTPANTATTTLGVPANGSIMIAGTGSDVIQMACE